MTTSYCICFAIILKLFMLTKIFFEITIRQGLLSYLTSRETLRYKINRSFKKGIPQL